MSIFFNNEKIKTLLELKVNGEQVPTEDDEDNSYSMDDDEENTQQEPEVAEEPQPEEQDDGDDQDTPTEYNMDDDENNEVEEPQEGENLDTPDEEPDGDDTEEDDTPSEYNMDDDESGDENNDNTGDDDTDSDYSMSDDDTDDDSGEDDGQDTDNGETEGDSGEEQDDLKELEKDIFRNIPEKQINIRNMELKNQYIEVYNTIDNILTRTSKISKTSDNSSIIEFIVNKLLELQDMVQFYLSNMYDNKTYVENNMNYQQYLVILNTINRLFIEIAPKKE